MVTGREQGDEGEGKEDGRGWWKGRDKRLVTDGERGVMGEERRMQRDEKAGIKRG